MRSRDERGLTDSVQWALLLPVVLLTIFGTIQVGLWAHGRSVASQAAITAAERGALLGADASGAREAGLQVAAAGGLVSVDVALEVSADHARAVVRGSVPMLVDVGITQIAYEATRPRERVVRP